VKLKRIEFESWLLERGESEAGIAGISSDCPLARFLQADDSHVLVAGDFYDDEDDSWPLPRWARRFIDGIDRVVPLGEHRVFSGNEALAILRSIR